MRMGSWSRSIKKLWGMGTIEKDIFLLAFVACIFCLAGCEEKKSQSEEIRFYSVYSNFGNEIYVDAETGVMYLYHDAYNAGGLSVMLDSEGNPLIWSETR